MIQIINLTILSGSLFLFLYVFMLFNNPDLQNGLLTSYIITVSKNSVNDKVITFYVYYFFMYLFIILPRLCGYWDSDKTMYRSAVYHRSRA